MSLKKSGLALALLATSFAAFGGDHDTHQSGAKGATDPRTFAYSDSTGVTRYGDALSMGNGRFHAYTKTLWNGMPGAIGVEFSAATLNNLPHEEPTDGANCWDNNGDDEIDLEAECAGGHGRTLFFDTNLTPFKSITINWEPHGHVPADVYDKPHFDFHFYMMGNTQRNLIAVGPCDGVTNCAQRARSSLPVPAKYVHPDFFNTTLVYTRMGNHYADGTSPEFHGLGFSQTFILGTHEGHITFYEPMVSLDYLLSKPNECVAVKQPAAFEKAGFYPTQYCMRFNANRNSYTVSLEAFRFRVAG